jgi:hypothetical protein
VAVTDDGKPILDDRVMREALILGGELNFPVVQHAEDTRMTEHCSMNAGARSFRLGLRGMTTAAEASIVERDVQLVTTIPNARLHVAHVSTGDALKAVRRGKRARSRITCEVTPHHFTLIDEDMREYDSNYKMNPPLRSAADREAILVALADGTVDAIATDHAPHLGLWGWKPRWDWRLRGCMWGNGFRWRALWSCSRRGRRAALTCAGAGRWGGERWRMSRFSIRRRSGRSRRRSRGRSRGTRRLTVGN